MTYEHITLPYTCVSRVMHKQRKLHAYNSINVSISSHTPLNISIFAKYTILKQSWRSAVSITALDFICKSFFNRIITMQVNQFPFLLRIYC